MIAERKLGILWISCVGEKGGAEVYMLNLLRHVDRSRFSPSVALLRPGPLADELRAIEVPTHVLPAHRMRDVFAVGRTVRSLARLVQQQGYDLVHSNGFRAHVYGGLAARSARVPEVWTVHTVEKAGPITATVFRIPTAHVIANCQRTADYFVARSCLTSRIWPSVDFAHLEPFTTRAELAERYDLRPEPRWVCMGGRLQRYKGHEFFLRALAALPSQAADVCGIIMGGSLFGMEPDYPAELNKLAQTLGIHERIRFTGFIPDADVHGFLAASEMLVHPALDEDFGLIVTEAQAMGKAVLAFNAVGPAAIVLPEQTGELVPVGNQEELNAALARMLSKPDTLLVWGQAGKRRVQELFGVPAAVEQLERVYAACLDPTGTRRESVRKVAKAHLQ
ncbi:MAG: glycosyltransferase family 4 protein [Limisphaerales bacterium]